MSGKIKYSPEAQKPMPKIILKSTLKRINLDEWGESSITFQIPQSYLKEVNKLSNETGKVLDIIIELENDKVTSK